MKDFFSKAVAKVKKDVVENKEELKENLKTAGYIAGGVAAVSLAPVAAVGLCQKYGYLVGKQQTFRHLGRHVKRIRKISQTAVGTLPRRFFTIVYTIGRLKRMSF